MEQEEAKPLYVIAARILEDHAKAKEIIREELPDPTQAQKDAAEFLYKRLKKRSFRSKKDVEVFYWGLISEGLRTSDPVHVRWSQILWPLLKQRYPI